MKYEKEWLKILNYVGLDGKEVGTFANSNKKKMYYMAKAVDENLIISKSEKLEPSCKINIYRIVNYKQFETIYDLYDRYINKEKGIRKQMMNACQNSTYIISIIHEVL